MAEAADNSAGVERVPQEEPFDEQGEHHVERGPPSDDEADPDFQVNQSQEGEEGTEDSEEERVTASQGVKRKRSPQKKRRKRIRNEQGQMYQKRRKFTQERRRRSYTKLEANAKVAREFVLVDTEDIPLPDTTKLRDVVCRTGDPNCYFDPRASSFFTCGPRMHFLTETTDRVKGFEMRYYRNNTPLRGYVHGLCGHIVENADPHKLCRNCQYVATNLLCYKPEDCKVCAGMTAEERQPRGARNGRPNVSLVMKSLGGRYEARHLLARWFYLEGVLWCLASIYEHQCNIEALWQCRANIGYLLDSQAPKELCITREPLPGDFDLPTDAPYDAREAVTEKHSRRRSLRVNQPLIETARAAYRRLKALADTKPATTTELQPIDAHAQNEAPLELFVDSEGLRQRAPDMVEIRRNGYYAMRMELKLRQFKVRVDPLPSAAQRRLKLQKLGLDPDLPFQPHKPKPGAKLTSRQRFSRKRNQARKFTPNQAPEVEAQGASQQATPQPPNNQQMYPLPVFRDDLQGSEVNFFASSSEYDGVVNAVAVEASEIAEDQLPDDAGEDNTSDESAASEDVVVDSNIASTSKEAAVKPTLAPFEELAQSVLDKRAEKPEPRRSDRLAQKYLKSVVTSVDEVRVESKNVVKRKGFVTKHGWNKMLYMQYRVKLALRRARRARPVKPKYRYQFRKAPPAPFLLFRAEMIFQHLCRAQLQREAEKLALSRYHDQRVSEETLRLRELQGITALTWEESSRIQALANMRAGYDCFSAKAAAKVNFVLEEKSRREAEELSPDGANSAELTPAQAAEINQLDDNATFPSGFEAGDLAQLMRGTRSVSSAGSKQSPKEVEKTRQPQAKKQRTIYDVAAEVCPAALEKKRPEATDTATAEDGPATGAKRRKGTPLKKQPQLVVVPLTPEDVQRYNAQAVVEAAKRQLFLEAEEVAGAQPPEAAPTAEADDAITHPTPDQGQAALVEPISDDETAQVDDIQERAVTSNGNEAHNNETDAHATEVAEHTTAKAVDVEISDKDCSAEAIAPPAGTERPASDSAEGDMYADMPDLEPPWPATHETKLPTTTEVVPSPVHDAPVCAASSTGTEAAGGAKPSEDDESHQLHRDETAEAAAPPHAGEQPAPEEVMEADRTTDEASATRQPLSEEELAARKAATDAKLGRITEGTWQKLCADFGANVDAVPRAPYIVDLIYTIGDMFGEKVNLMDTHAVKAVVAMQRLINQNETQVDLPSRVEQCQLALLINKFLTEFPELLAQEPNPWDELSVLYSCGRRDVEQEVERTTAAVEALLSPNGEMTGPDATAPPETPTGRLFRRVNELLAETARISNEKTNVQVELSEVGKNYDILARKFAKADQDLARSRDANNRMKATLEARNTEIEKLGKLLEETKTTHRLAIEHQTKQLEDQRKHDAAASKLLRDENIAFRESVREAKEAREKAENKLKDAERLYQEDLEERPADDREVRLMRKHVKQLHEEEDKMRRDLIEKTVTIDDLKSKIASLSKVCRSGGRFIHHAVRDVLSPSMRGPPSTITSGPGSSRASIVDEPTDFNETVSRLRAEALYVSEQDPFKIIPDDLLDVEPEPIGNVHFSPPIWDMYLSPN